MDDKTDQSGPTASLSAERMASLSDTMFGVAMTLVATTLLPAVEANKGSILDLLGATSGELVSVLLSFAISARYWVSQQQRLAMSVRLNARQTWLHLSFLFLIVLLPISTSLPSLAGSDVNKGSVVAYGAHLALIALFNLVLWLELRGDAGARLPIVRSAVALALLIVALPVSAIRPDFAVYVWFAVPVAASLARPL